jgi:hypothetical protein
MGPGTCGGRGALPQGGGEKEVGHGCQPWVQGHMTTWEPTSQGAKIMKSVTGLETRGNMRVSRRYKNTWWYGSPCLP